MTKKIKYILLFGILIILGLCTKSQARITTSDPTVKSGGTVTITINSQEPVSSGSIDVTSDGGLTFVDVKGGQKNGTRVAFAGSENMTSGIATYTFKAPNVSKTTTYKVTFASYDMANIDGEEVASSNATATVTVEAEETTDPGDNNQSGGGNSGGGNSGGSGSGGSSEQGGSSGGNGSSSGEEVNLTFTSVNEKVYAPDGCVVALGYEGYLGVGADSGKSFEYPFLENRHVFAATYSNGDFDYIEEQGMTQNMMIRATGKRLADNGGEESEVEEGAVMPDFCKYNVYRLTESQISTPDAWTLVKENAETAEFTDTPVDLPDGVYAYAVRTVYPDGSMSEASMSQFVGYHMYTNVTVNVKSNSEGEGAQGALVSMTGQARQNSYNVAVDENGCALFPTLVKDKYDMTITLEGYEAVSEVVDFSVENSYTTEAYLLKEIISDPINLTIENYDKDAKTALFTWNTSAVIFDDFEDHEDFAIDSPGKAGWEYWDLDGQPTWGFTGATFPGNGDYMSFMVFNPSVVETENPDMPLTEYPHYRRTLPFRDAAKPMKPYPRYRGPEGHSHNIFASAFYTWPPFYLTASAPTPSSSNLRKGSPSYMPFRPIPFRHNRDLS